MSDPSDFDCLSRLAVTELVNLPKTGKTAGPDHRVALYSMLALLRPSPDVSLSLIEEIATLIPKEPHENAIVTLASAMLPHIVLLLRNASLPSYVAQLIAKEMNNSKSGVRKAFVGLAGSIFLENEDILETEHGLNLAKELFPAFEICLKTAGNNPLNSSGGPYEGYVALTVLLGPLARSKQFGQ